MAQMAASKQQIQNKTTVDLRGVCQEPELASSLGYMNLSESVDSTSADGRFSSDSDSELPIG